MLTSLSKIKDKLYDVKYDRIEQGKGLGIEEIDQFYQYLAALYYFQ